MAPVVTLLTVREVAELLKVSPDFVRDHLADFGAIVEAGEGRGKRGRAPKRLIRIPLSGVETWIRHRSIPVRIHDSLAAQPRRRSHNSSSEEISRIIREARRSA